MKRSLVVATIRRASVYELVLVLATATSALANLIDPATRSKVLQGALGSEWAVNVYSIGSIIGAVAVFVGWLLTERGLRSSRHGPSVGMQIERAGLLLLGPLLCSYAIAVFAFSQPGALAGAVTAACGIAHLVRAYQITTDLLTIRIMTEEAN